jgi:hypothetical protein
MPRASLGISSSTSLLKSTCVHQQGGCFSPVARSISIAHRFGWPQSGQDVASKWEAALGTAKV